VTNISISGKFKGPSTCYSFQYERQYIHLIDIIERKSCDDRLNWHLPCKQYIFKNHIPEKIYQKMFTDVRFSIGGPKK